MSRRKRLRIAVVRILGFATVSAVPVVSPLLIPAAVTRSAGGDGWLALSVGQSVGAVVGVACALAWPLHGPPVVASASPLVRSRLYSRSIETRLLAFILAAPVGSVVAALLVPSFKIAAALTAVAIGANGLSLLWFYIGTGASKQALLLETVPRAIATALAAGAVVMGAPIEIYPVLLLLSSTLTLIRSIRLLGEDGSIRLSFDRFSNIRTQSRYTGSRLITGVYFDGATSLVAASNPPVAFVFAALDRLMKATFNAALAIPYSMVSQLRPSDDRFRVRRRNALFLDFLASVTLGAIFVLILPTLVRFMFNGLVSLSWTQSCLVSSALVLALFARSLILNGLLPSQLDKQAARVASVTGLIGIALIPASAISIGVDGPFWTIIVLEGGALVASVLLIGRGRSLTDPVPQLPAAGHEAVLGSLGSRSIKESP